MDEMLHQQWLVESPKFETIGDYGLWRNHKCYYIYIYNFWVVLVVCKLWALVCCSSCFDDVQIRFWWWNVVFIFSFVVWWKCICVDTREMEWLTWGKDKRKAMGEGKDLSFTLMWFFYNMGKCWLMGKMLKVFLLK